MSFRGLFRTGFSTLVKNATLSNIKINPNFHPHTRQMRNFSDSLKDTGFESFSDVPGVKTAREKLIMIYTCKVCDTRSAKKYIKIWF
jgi:hypothetical protein